jgi:hypothetical protein
MGRSKERDKVQKLIRIPQELWLEAIMLNPSLQDETGYMRYGGISQYFIRLMQRDNNEIKTRIRANTEALNGQPISSNTPGL